jgi:acetyl-CoA carboxylase carboxyl transferase subunit beta
VSWLTNVVRPKLRELVGSSRQLPDNLWDKCQACGQMIFHRELEKNLRVCPHCGHHLRLGARERMAMLFDDGAWQGVEVPRTVVDPLKFRDLRKYTERLKEAQVKTGHADAMIVGRGRMGGEPVVIAVLDFEFMGGSMGIAVGEALIVAAHQAVSDRAPLIVVPASGGARMQEGILSLMQMARTTIAIQECRDAALPYIVVLTDPTTGGVSASFAMLGDITLAEPGAVIGFAGARVIQQTIRETLPEGFQRAEYLLEHGIIDMVVRRHELRETLIRIITLIRNPKPLAVPRLPARAQGQPLAAAEPGDGQAVAAAGAEAAGGDRAAE